MLCMFCAFTMRAQYIPFTYCQVEEGDTIAVGFFVAGTGLYRKEEIRNASIQKSFTVGDTEEPVFVPGANFLFHVRVAHPKVQPLTVDVIYRGEFHTRGIASMVSILAGEDNFLLGLTSGVTAKRVNENTQHTTGSEIGIYEHSFLFGPTFACMSKKLRVHLQYEVLMDTQLARSDQIEIAKLFRVGNSMVGCGFVSAAHTGFSVSYMHPRFFCKAEVYPSGAVRTETFYAARIAYNIMR